jgi:proteic killer suppression protein
MNVRHADKKLERLEIDESYTTGFGPDIVRAYRKVMGIIRAAFDERAFYAMKSLHYEKLKGNRSHQRSMRLNKQFRLILEIRDEGRKTAVIISIEDYH